MLSFFSPTLLLTLADLDIGGIKWSLGITRTLPMLFSGDFSGVNGPFLGLILVATLALLRRGVPSSMNLRLKNWGFFFWREAVTLEEISSLTVSVEIFSVRSFLT